MTLQVLALHLYGPALLQLELNAFDKEHKAKEDVVPRGGVKWKRKLNDDVYPMTSSFGNRDQKCQMTTVSVTPIPDHMLLILSKS